MFVTADGFTPFEPASGSAWSELRHPTPLSADEELLPAVESLAHKFNPAMALPTRDIWPVDVAYAWADGADLVAQTLDGRGDVTSQYIAAPHATLDQKSWAGLPALDERGQRIRYRVDVPGDDQLNPNGESAWRQRWSALAGRFAPTQYAHVFWFNRAAGLLGIQYWFFFPFNEWINHHEGDWEHINVVLKGPSNLTDASPSDFVPTGYEFFFHGWRYEPARVMRVAGKSDMGASGREDHVVVFTGGRGRFLWWGGRQSGGSYPWPAVYSGAGKGLFSPDDDTRSPERYLAPGEFRIVLLPEADHLDAKVHPELSWLRLDFFAGQEKMHNNPPLLDWLGHGGPPPQPARHSGWNAAERRRVWPRVAHAEPAALPSDWPLLR